MKIIIPQKMFNQLRECLDIYVCNTFSMLELDHRFDINTFMKRGRCVCPYCDMNTFIVNDRGKRSANYHQHTYKCMNCVNAEFDSSCPLSYGGDLFNLIPIIEPMLGDTICDTSDFTEIMYCAAVRVGLLDRDRIESEADGRHVVELNKWHNDTPVILLSE